MFIKDIDTLKQFVSGPAASGIKWLSIAPEIRLAELKYIAPAIGGDFYTLLAEANDTNALQTEEQALLPYLQAAVAPLAIFLYTFSADVSIGDAGIQRQETGNNKTAYKYQLLALRDTILDTGLEAIERLLEYLGKHASDFAAWQDSDAQTAANELLIRSGRELKSYYTSLRQPQRTYGSMISIIRTCEDLTLGRILGDQYQELKDHDIAGTATLFEKSVTKTLKKSLAHLAISKAIVQIDVRLDDSGASQLATGRTDPTRGEDSNRSNATATSTRELAEQCWSIGLSYLDAAVRYLSTNASETVFPTWYAKMQAEAAAVPQPADINPSLNGAFCL